MRSNKLWIATILVLLVVIIVMAWFLIKTPAPTTSISDGVQTTSTTVHTTGPAQAGTPGIGGTPPLSTSVVVSTPASGAILGKSFTVSGSAPNAWYNEAVFPIQVRDPDDNLLASTQGQAQSDWTVAGPVRFTASIAITTDYSGPATLILLRDNPSGLPQNADEVSIPITIK